MANPKKGRWVLISDGDPDNLARFFRGCREQGIETQGVVMNCPNGEFDWPEHWSRLKGGPVPKPGDEWFGILWHDQCPQSTGWDIAMVTSVRPWSVVTSQDASGGDWRCGAVVWGIECFMAGKGLDLNFLGPELASWSRGGRESKCWFVSQTALPRRDVPVPVGIGGATFDAIAGHVEGRAPRLTECMARHGVRVCEPDYRGVSLMVSTPSIHSPAVEYMTSLMAMQQMFVQMGVPMQWALERWNADIVMARSHIVAEFLRTPCTHLLMVDDDMSFEPSAVHRLFYVDQDVVAVAGPKKSYPLKFAANKVDDHGMPIPISIDPATGAAEVDHVGCAFMLVRREALERMVEAYPETAYIGSDGKKSHALFMQTIEDGVYRPEDFSFCSRWRKIGGKVYICPDVALGHIGQHEYKGSMMENAQARHVPATIVR